MKFSIYVLIVILSITACTQKNDDAEMNVVLIQKYIEAVENLDYSGMDSVLDDNYPLNPTQVVGAEVDRSVDGTALVGAAGGAAGGAAISAIAGDAGKGAAIGAVVVGIRGRRAKVEGDERQQQANDQAAADKAKELSNDYNKAFAVCMEGKGYKVK